MFRVRGQPDILARLGKEAIAVYQEAVQKKQNYSPAYALLANVLFILIRFQDEL
jgi:hypothetical protein